ncbi:MAG: hypothetical protein AB1568_14160 [Thermodesulfobacteriota bacterium]
MDYHAKLMDHLCHYKEFHLGIRTSGAERRRQHPALPREFFDLNILPGYRRPFRALAERAPLFDLQGDFHCLHSSQALCFNFFIPFVQHPSRHDILLTALGQAGDTISATSFELFYGPETDELFDFYMELGSGQRLYFDVKLAENWFGPAHQSAMRSDALLASSRADIVGLVSGDVLKSPDAARLIVLLKKLAYVCCGEERRLCCIFPRANQRLHEAMRLLLRSLYPALREKIVVLHLEDLVAAVRRAGAKAGREDVVRHFQQLERKYIPADREAGRP